MLAVGISEVSESCSALLLVNRKSSFSKLLDGLTLGVGCGGRSVLHSIRHILLDSASSMLCGPICMDQFFYWGQFLIPLRSHALQASSHVLCLMVLGDYLVLKGSAAWHPLMPAYSSAMCAALGTMWLRNFFRALTWALWKRQSVLRRKLASIVLYGRNT